MVQGMTCEQLRQGLMQQEEDMEDQWMRQREHATRHRLLLALISHRTGFRRSFYF